MLERTENMFAQLEQDSRVLHALLEYLKLAFEVCYDGKENPLGVDNPEEKCMINKSKVRWEQEWRPYPKCKEYGVVIKPKPKGEAK